MHPKNKVCSIVLIFLALTIDLFAQGVPDKTNHKSISLTLQFPKSKSENIVSAQKIDTAYDIKLVIKNNTDTLTSFWGDKNTYGYYNIGFEIRTSDTLIRLGRDGGCWSKNLVSSSMLFPGDSLIFSYDIESCKLTGCKCFNNIPEKSLKGARIRAIYQFPLENHLSVVREVFQHGEGFLLLGSSHFEKFKSLSLIQKLRSYVTDKLISEEYEITFLGSDSN